MTPVEQATKLYESIGKNFNDVLLDHSANHYAHFTPDGLIMARCLDTAWFIEVAIGTGSMRYWLELMPVYRPFVGWAREFKNCKTIKWYKTETLWRLL